MKSYKIKNAWAKLVGRFLDILLPVECLGCGQADQWLCPNCLAKIKFQKIDQCLVCKKTTYLGQTHQGCREKTWLDGVVIAADWEDPLLQDAIHKYKYKFVTDLAEPLAQILVKKITEPGWAQLFKGKNIMLVPVPLHQRRWRWRGFNQAELLAEKIGNKFNWPVMGSLMFRRRYTRPQAKLKKEEREKNLVGVFGVGTRVSGELKDRTIILVDDVITTGTTVNECAKILKENGAKEVWGIALARG